MPLPLLYGLRSPDLERDFEPPNPSSCAVFISAQIGPRSGGSEDFGFTVITPDQVATDGLPRWGRGYLIVDRFSWDSVAVAVEKLLMHADRPTWRESAVELNKELHWEFDNYTDGGSR